MRIVVCPHAALAAVAAEAAPKRVVVLQSPGREPPRPGGSVPVHVVAFHDIAAARDDLRPPDEAAIAAILDFVVDGPVIVSCEMGVSRSTAVAFALACRAAPYCHEAELAAALRRTIPVATPNPLVVAHADRLLARDGRMVAAVSALGRGADYAPYRSATLDLADIAA